MALTPLSEHREQLIFFKIVVVPDANSQEGIHPLPLYRLNLRRKRFLISETIAEQKTRQRAKRSFKMDRGTTARCGQGNNPGEP